MDNKPIISLDQIEWRSIYGKRYRTSDPRIIVERSVCYIFRKERRFPPRGFIPITRTGDFIHPQKITVNEFLLIEPGTNLRSLGHKVGISIPLNTISINIPHKKIKSDPDYRQQVLKKILNIYRHVNPYLIINDTNYNLDSDFANREFHISMAGYFNSVPTTMFTYYNDYLRGNVHYGNNGLLNQDTNGQLDWSGVHPYLTKRQVTGSDVPYMFEGWIGDIIVDNDIGNNPSDHNILMVFAGVRIYQPWDEIKQKFNATSIKHHIRDKTLPNQPLLVKPYLIVRQKHSNNQ